MNTERRVDDAKALQCEYIIREGGAWDWQLEEIIADLLADRADDIKRIAELEQQVKAQAKVIEETARALIDYGKHQHDCMLECTCGLQAARYSAQKAIDAAQGKES